MSLSAAVQKHVAVLERGRAAHQATPRSRAAGQRRRGGGPLRRLDADELEDVWRGRIARIDDLPNKET